MRILSIKFVLMAAFCCAPMIAMAEDTVKPNNTNIYEIRYNWDNDVIQSDAPFKATKPTEIEVEPSAKSQHTALIETKDSQPKKKGKDIEDRILDILPFKNTLKQTWNVIDGDVDLMNIEGFRFDRGNKGLMYKTNVIPFMGEVDGMEIEFCAGEDNEINFESSAIPFVGEVEGFNLKSSVSEDNSRVYMQYTYKFD